MHQGRIILHHERLMLTLERLALSILESCPHDEEVCIIGIQERGVLFSDKIVENFSQHAQGILFKYGKLDITFFRDDFRRRDTPLKAFSTEMPFLVEGKKVILVDDVLYTGRTIQAAMAALQAFGRPSSVELMCLVDRRFNRHFPIQADHVGITIDSLEEAYVKVNWDIENKNHNVVIYPGKI